MLTETEIAYIAGVLDSDGWMSLNDNGYVVTFNCGIVSTHKDVLDWICSEFGGTVRTHSRPKSRKGKNWTQTWSYIPLSDSIKPFLEATRPYLRMKPRQCDILLEFLDTRAKRGPGNYRTPPEVITRRNELLIEVRKLNQVGKQPKLYFKELRTPKYDDKPHDWAASNLKPKTQPSDSSPVVKSDG